MAAKAFARGTLARLVPFDQEGLIIVLRIREILEISHVRALMSATGLTAFSFALTFSSTMGLTVITPGLASRLSAEAAPATLGTAVLVEKLLLGFRHSQLSHVGVVDDIEIIVR